MSAPPRAGKPRRSISWLGLTAILGGLGVIILYYDHPRLSGESNPLISIIYVGTGSILILLGLRAVIAEMFAVALFKPRAQPARRYRVRMTSAGIMYVVILIVLFLGALLGRSNMLMLVFGLLAGPFILNGQMTLGILRRLSVQRKLPEYATVDEIFSVTLGLSNKKRFLSSWMVVAEDSVQNPGEQMQPAVLFSCVPARANRETAYEIRPARRGIYEFGPVRVLSRFPLGLMERSFEMGAVEQLIVYPRIGRLKPRWRQSVDFGDSVAEGVLARVGSGDDEFQCLREYRGGDNPRDIHWRTTARRSQLMVREYQHKRRHDLSIVVDLWVPVRAKPADLVRVEMAVSFAASVCVDQMQSAADSDVALVVCGRATRRASGSAGGRSIGLLLEELALAQAGSSIELPGALRQAAEEAAPQHRKVLITTRGREAIEGALAAGETGEHSPAALGFEIIEADPRHLEKFFSLTAIDNVAGGPA